MSKGFISTISQLLVLALLLPLIAATLGTFDAGRSFLADVLNEAVGGIPLFDVVIQMLSGLQPGESALSTCIAAIKLAAARAALSTLLMGMAINLALAATTRLSAATTKRFVTYQLVGVPAPILPTIAGAALGVLFIRMIDAVPSAQLQSLFYALFTIGLMLLGLGMMLRFRGPSSGFLLSQAAGALFDVVMAVPVAVCCAVAVCALCLAPLYGSFTALFNALMALYFASGLGAVAISAVLAFMKIGKEAQKERLRHHW